MALIIPVNMTCLRNKISIIITTGALKRHQRPVYAQFIQPCSVNCGMARNPIRPFSDGESLHGSVVYDMRNISKEFFYE